MKAILSSTALILGLITSAGVSAAPAGATGLCKDGTYATGTAKTSACRGHKGIQEWYATAGTTASVTTTASPVKAPKTVKTTTTTSVTASGAMPAGATGLCKDGTYTTGATKTSACRGHKGIQTWYATAGTTAAVTTAAPTMTTKVTKATTATVAPTGAAPAGATGLCKDGTYNTSANKQGACRGHKGIQEWYGPAAAGAATVGATAAVTTPAAAPAAAPAPEKKGMFSFLNKKPDLAPTTATPATTTTTATRATTTTHAAPAAIAVGGGAGKVWVNTESNVYHCEGSHWYGTTKAGSYMTEAQAQAAGARPTHGKACK